jgi:hypothetical protein
VEEQPVPQNESVGLFLGAGASFELGMPLVWDLTAELKAWLTPAKLRELNESWRSQGGGHPDAVIDDLASWLTLPQAHYESILGHLETQFRRASGAQQEYHALYSRLVELVYFIFYFRHVYNVEYIERNLHYIEGITNLAAKNSPLWIFSLNHDLIIECLAAYYNIPLNCGFTTDAFTLPRRNRSGATTGELKAETLTADQLEKGMPFFQPGKSGINLLKIHGALDIFTFSDGKDLMKLLPLEPTVVGVMGALRAANEELFYISPQLPGPVKTTNEITYADDVGTMQFLRRSLLAGAFKFESRHSQVLPHRLLAHFGANLNHVSTLICIGYGFADDHINQVIRRWLEFNTERKIEIVSPTINSIPPSLLHLATQVTLTRSTGTDYLDKVAGIVRGRRDILQKRLGAWIRQQPDREKAKNALPLFLQQYLQTRTTAFVENLATLPRREGNMDVQALGITPTELAQLWSDELGVSFEDLLEAFLLAQEPKP